MNNHEDRLTKEAMDATTASEIAIRVAFIKAAEEFGGPASVCGMVNAAAGVIGAASACAPPGEMREFLRESMQDDEAAASYNKAVLALLDLYEAEREVFEELADA